MGRRRRGKLMQPRPSDLLAESKTNAECASSTWPMWMDTLTWLEADAYK